MTRNLHPYLNNFGQFHGHGFSNPLSFISVYKTKRQRRFERRGIDIKSYNSSSDSKIDLDYFRTVVVERNHQRRVAPPTKKAYHAIFDNFLDFLDLFKTLPDKWEEKMVLYATFLADNSYDEGTINSYMSAIRYQLQQDGNI